jgi:hypothetical protein
MPRGSLSRVTKAFEITAVCAVSFFIAFCNGCSGKPEGPETFPVTGKVVTANGLWTAGGNVEFRPYKSDKNSDPKNHQDGQQQGIAMGQIKSDGTFELGTSTKHGRSAGAVAGKYSVTLTLSDPADPQLVRTVILPEPVSVLAQDSNEIELTLPE